MRDCARVNCSMNTTRIFGIFLLVSTMATAGFPQDSSRVSSNPKEVVEKLWKMETAGDTLTPEGWSKSSALFIRLSTQRALQIIHVIRNRQFASFEETARTANWAEVSVTTDEVGQIGSDFRFRALPKRGSQGVLFVAGPVITFNVVLTDKRWPVNPDGSRGAEVVGPPAWRITGNDLGTWIDVQAALQYLRELRSKARDLTLRQNAAKTIAKLRTYQ